MSSKLEFLFENTSMHGFKYLANQNSIGWKKSFARVFWTTFIAISLFYMIKMLRNMLTHKSASTSINLDTNYRDWDNPFPAISICMMKGRSTDPIKQYIGNEHVKENGEKIKLLMRHYRAMQAVIFMNYNEPMEGINLEHCFELNETCGLDIRKAKQELLPKSCKSFMEKTFFLEKEVDCEDFFKLYEVEQGTCFVANSIYSKGRRGDSNLEDFKSLPLFYNNQDNVERSFEMHYKENNFLQYRLIIHTPEELPNGKMENFGLRKIGSQTIIALKTIEFQNQPDVKHEPIGARNCRFPFERFSQFPQFSTELPYSINYCMYLTRIGKEMKSCNCTFPFGFVNNHTMRICNLNEFTCLHDLSEETKHAIKHKHDPIEIFGNCLTPSCISMEIIKVGEYDRPIPKHYKIDDDKKIGAVKIEIINKPTLRYIRRVTMTKLDMMGE